MKIALLYVVVILQHTYGNETPWEAEKGYGHRFGEVWLLEIKSNFARLMPVFPSHVVECTHFRVRVDSKPVSIGSTRLPESFRRTSGGFFQNG
jgi:hypothetical protein